MDFIKSELKNIIIFVVLLIGIFFSYRYFFGSPSGSEVVTVASPSGELMGSTGAGVGDDILPVLLAIKSIRLDNSFFTDPAFNSLQNFGVQLTPEEAGRDNPFAPLIGPAQPTGNNNIVIKAFRSN
jgi:hypothetical protein